MLEYGCSGATGGNAYSFKYSPWMAHHVMSRKRVLNTQQRNTHAISLRWSHTDTSPITLIDELKSDRAKSDKNDNAFHESKKSAEAEPQTTAQ